MTRRLAALCALAAWLDGVSFSAAASPSPSPQSTEIVTFSKQIAPIVFNKCGACHHPDGDAPFSLLSYDAARAHATQIAAAVRSGFMPPWKADPDAGEFIGQSRLSDSEKQLLERWVEEGAPEGNRRDLPAAPHWSEGWELGTPDLVIRPAGYTLPPEGTDVFRIFVVRIPVDRVRYVRGLEFRPRNTVVHHANIRVDRTDTSRRFDAADPAPGYEGLLARSAGYPDGHFLGWTPGQVSPLLPKGMAWRLDPGTDLVIELHMQPSGKPENIDPLIGFYFGSDPPERTPAMLRLGRQTIDIPPGVKNYTISDSFVLPVDVEVQAVQPHAHHRAREVTGTATLPDGTTRPLIHIADWDFRWQHVYRYVKPFTLPKGTRLAMRFVYDNSAENLRNPTQPPQRVYWGQRSGDEMGDLWIQVLTRDDRDLQVLESQFAPKVMAEDVIGYERWITTEPASAALHDDVAVLYLQLNRAADAVRHFTISSQLQPESASAHFNLATALTVAGQLDAAENEYARALALKPDYAQAHNNLGSLLLGTGRIDAALTHLDAALRIDPASPQAHYNAGLAAREQGRAGDAIDHLKRAVQLNADWPPALVDLAWLLAAARDAGLREPTLAVRLGERAAVLTERKDAAALDALAAAYASTGDFTRAIDSAQAAIQLRPTDVEAIQKRLDLYRRGEVFRF